MLHIKRTSKSKSDFASHASSMDRSKVSREKYTLEYINISTLKDIYWYILGLTY
jgi:hypothetical protein